MAGEEEAVEVTTSQSGLGTRRGGGGGGARGGCRGLCAALRLLWRAEGAQVSRLLGAMREAMREAAARGAEAVASPGAHHALGALRAALGRPAGPGAPTGIDAALGSSWLLARRPARRVGWRAAAPRMGPPRRARLVARLAALRMLGGEAAAALRAEVSPVWRHSARRGRRAAGSARNPRPLRRCGRCRPSWRTSRSSPPRQTAAASGGAATLVACGAVEAGTAVLARRCPEPSPPRAAQHAHLVARRASRAARSPRSAAAAARSRRC